MVVALKVAFKSQVAGVAEVLQDLLVKWKIDFALSGLEAVVICEMDMPEISGIVA